VARSLVAAVVLSCVLLGACANRDDYTAATTRADLEAVGLTEAEADCVVRRMEARFGIRRLSAREEPTRLEREEMDRLLEACLG